MQDASTIPMGSSAESMYAKRKKNVTFNWKIELNYDWDPKLKLLPYFFK